MHEEPLKGHLPGRELSQVAICFVLLGLLLSIEVCLAAAIAFVPWYLVTALLVVVFALVLFCIKLEWSAYWFVALLVVTNIRISIFPPSETMFNVMYCYHVLTLVTCFAWMAKRAVALSWERKVQSGALGYAIVAFGTWAAASTMWATEHAWSLFRLCQFVLVIASFFLISCLVRTTTEMLRVVKAWIVMGVLVAAALVLSLLLKEMIVWPVELLPGRLFAFFYVGHVNMMRGSGLTDPKVAANFINTAFLFSIGLLTLPGDVKKKTVLGLTMMVLIFCEFFTQVRGALVGFFAAVGFLIVSLRPLRRRLISSFNLFWFVFIVLFLIFMSIAGIVLEYHGIERSGVKTTSVGQMDQSMEVRIQIWRGVYKVVADKRAQLHGLGIGMSQYTVGGLPDVDSVYFATFFDLGLVGLLLGGLILVTMVPRLFFTLKLPECPERTVLCCFFAGLLALAVNALIEWGYTLPLLWGFLGFGNAFYWIAKRQAAGTKPGHD